MADLDNQQPDESISNRVPHVHHYVLKGSGLSCYAECDVGCYCGCGLPVCGEKLAGDNGPIAFYEEASGGKFSCEANRTAQHHILEALDALDSRTREREARGVEGTHAR